MKINKADFIMRRPGIRSTQAWIPEEALLELKHNLINVKRMSTEIKYYKTLNIWRVSFISRFWR